MIAKVLNFNEPDAQGDIFKVGSVKFSNPVKVLENFKPERVMFTVDIEEHEDGLYADFPENNSIKGLYPAIGYKTVKKSRLVELFAIGLCHSVNIDPKIMPL